MSTNKKADYRHKGFIAILCRNNLALTKACLPTLLRQTQPCTVMVFNNNSTDGSAAWLRSQQMRFTNLRVITVRETASVSALWNTAAKTAWLYGAKDLLIVNQDTELLPETYEVLRAALPDAGMVTCVSRRHREELVYDRAHMTARPNPDFSCFLLRKKAWEIVGPFDEEFVGAFFEDNDYHVRMHFLGIKAMCLDMPFLHHGSQTIKRADPIERLRIEKNAEKNRMRFYTKYGCYPGTQGYEDLFHKRLFGITPAIVRGALEAAEAKYPPSTIPEVDSSFGQ